MSLPARQQRKLREIEGGLTGSDPRLRPVADALAAFRSLIRRIARRPASRVRALLLLPAALSAMVCGIMIAAGLSGAQRPAHASAKPPAARELILKTSRICRLGVIRYPALAC